MDVTSELEAVEFHKFQYRLPGSLILPPIKA